MNPAVSVIIPAYNAGRYVEEAIRSVQAQDFEDYELVLVDDGSTDDTGAIFDRAAAGDRRVRVIRRPNGGHSEARNRGLDEARGRWIYFIDADDVMAPHALSTLVGEAERTGAQLVLARFRAFRTRLPRVKRGGWRTTLLDGAAAAMEGMYQRRIDNAPWGKLYERELWEGLRFRKGIIYEDLDLFYRVWARAGRVALMEEPLYFYRQHGGSTMHVFNRRRLDVLDVTDRMLAWARDEGPEMEAAAADRRMSAHFNILLLMYKHGVRDEATEERCLRVLREAAPLSLRNGRVRLKNRLGALAFMAGGKTAARFMTFNV
ncbi:MAG: glycosyltransferase family 2 protein [Muribaculaceae bacterium]|nr:glycosyltransferase family 2 protein [Muribaculaceae bacterium]